MSKQMEVMLNLLFLMRMELFICGCFACVSCPSEYACRVRFMIKNMLQYYFDEVNDVKHVDWEEEEGKISIIIL